MHLDSDNSAVNLALQVSQILDEQDPHEGGSHVNLLICKEKSKLKWDV